jgi:cytoskeletal protein CcmA (bactofilin family)
MALFNKEPDKGPKVQPVQPNNVSNLQPHAAASGNPSTSQNPAMAPNAAASQAAAASRMASEGRAYFDRGTKISGKISFDGPARIDGEIDGEINSKEALVIGETAIVTAQIKAASVVVGGKVSGDIVASQKIEVRASAKVAGNLTAPLLVIQEGALFEGHCSMQPEAAREDRKVTVFPKEERVVQAAVAGQKQA